MNVVNDKQLTERRIEEEQKTVQKVDQAQSTVEQHGHLVLSEKAFHLDGAQPLDVM